MRQIGISTGLRTPDASTQLIQLGKAKAVGAMDDQGIRARYVQSAFDNRRRQKDVVALFVERAHAFFDLRR